MEQSHDFRNVDDLMPHPLYRKFYPEISEATIERFITAIQHSNYISPIIITKENVILDGHHRYCAAKRMEIKIVPVTVMADAKANYTLVTYNCARSNTMEEKIFQAKRIKAACDLHGIKPGPKNCHDGTNVTADDIAKMFDMSYRTMIRTLKLLEIIPELQNKFRKNELGIRAVEKIANEIDEHMQKELYLKICDIKLNENELFKLIDTMTGKETPSSDVTQSTSTGPQKNPINNVKTKVIQNAERDLKKLREKVILHKQLFKDNPTTVSAILSGINEIKRELEDGGNG
ncbi:MULTISPECIES: ParB/RepB/Spo0J family partition protein [unclassified Paenibacillus]|uniref:ParB/RepB/Spo0J family partition protein n=1 Tax=unclassified Paenibacillus TaxID=185978 RepID=UPI003636FB06